VALTATEEAVGSVEEDRAGIRLLLIHFCLRHTGYIRYPGGLFLGDGARQQARKAVLPRRRGNMNIYVGNLSLEVTDQELQREFMAFGEVVSVTVMNNKHIGSGKSRGYGFVEMPSRSEGHAAIIGLDGKSLKDRTIDVIRAHALSKNSHQRSYGNHRDSWSSSRVR
jgi:RNA recognition motif-containing protein